MNQFVDLIEQLLLQICTILLHNIILKLQLIKGNDDHLPLLNPKLGIQEVHRLPKLPIILNNLLLLLVGVLVTFLAEGVE